MEPDPDIITKAELARRRGVTPGRVSQWLSEGKISGEAIVGEGRKARIRETVAVEQLRERLDITQRYGNGLATCLQISRPPPVFEPACGPGAPGAAAPEPIRAIAPTDPVEELIKAARLEELQRRNRKSAEEETARAGRLVEADAAAQQYGKIAAQIVGVMDGALGKFAAAFSARFQLPQRDALHLLRAEFREVRAAAAASLKRLGADMPDLIAFEMRADDTQEVSESGLDLTRSA